jgi:hypothetical protein
VDWLLGPDGADASGALARIVDGTKALNFKLARRRPFDTQAAVQPLADAWAEAMTSLDHALR